MEDKNITALIISAGLSKRMGKFKPLLNYNGDSFLKIITGKVLSVCNEVIIITGYNSQLIRNHIDGWNNNLKSKIKLIHNAEYERGMFTSLKRGAEEVEKSNWILYHFVDQPTLPQKFYSDFINQVENGYDWIQPINKGQKGHPVLFGEKVIEKIKYASDNSNLREITFTGISKKYWECNYKEILDDIDNIEDYKKILY